MGWKTERLLAIMLLLQSKGSLTARKLSKILEVSERTIYRDIQSLSVAGVPVCESPGPRGGYTLPENYAIEPTLFTQDEMVSLVLGGSIIEQYRHLDIAGSAKSALLKIESRLPSVYQEYIQDAKKRILFDMEGWSQELEENPFLGILKDAIFRHHKVRLRYKTNCKVLSTNGEVDPYGIVCRNGVWYLVGFCHTLGQFRVFSVHNIKGIKRLKEWFKPDPGFNLQKMWKDFKERR